MARRSTTHIVGSRLLQSLPVILLATFIVFSLLKLLPGDIAVTLAGELEWNSSGSVPSS